MPSIERALAWLAPSLARRQGVRRLVGAVRAPEREPVGGRPAHAHEHGDRHPARAADDSRAHAVRPSHRARRSRSRTAATWRRAFPGRSWSSCPGPTTRPSSIPTRSSSRSRSSCTESGSERAWEQTEIDRVLATVLFTDIVGSTEKAVELGDREWHELVERHHGLVRSQLAALPRDGRSTRPATASSRPSTGPPARSSAPAPSPSPSATSASRSAPACTRVRWS